MWLHDLIIKILRDSRKTQKYLRVVFLKVNPEKKVSSGTLVVVCAGGSPKWLRFRCPCGCGDELVLPLMKGYTPHWEIIQNPNKTLTVIPSINVTRKCGAHFFIKENKVVMI